MVSLPPPLPPPPKSAYAFSPFIFAEPSRLRTLCSLLAALNAKETATSIALLLLLLRSQVAPLLSTSPQFQLEQDVIRIDTSHRLFREVPG